MSWSFRVFSIITVGLLCLGALALQASAQTAPQYDGLEVRFGQGGTVPPATRFDGLETRFGSGQDAPVNAPATSPVSGGVDLTLVLVLVAAAALIGATAGYGSHHLRTRTRPAVSS